jgi:hypothetical protein
VTAMALHSRAGTRPQTSNRSWHDVSRSAKSWSWATPAGAEDGKSGNGALCGRNNHTGDI